MASVSRQCMAPPLSRHWSTVRATVRDARHWDAPLSANFDSDPTMVVSGPPLYGEKTRSERECPA